LRFDSFVGGSFIRSRRVAKERKGGLRLPSFFFYSFRVVVVVVVVFYAVLVFY